MSINSDRDSQDTLSADDGREHGRIGHVVGLGEPCWIRIGFTAREMPLIGDQLRAERAEATRIAAGIHEVAGADAHSVDAAHDRLREIEAVMQFIEEQAERDADGRTWLTASAPVFERTVIAVAQHVIDVLIAKHEHFTTHNGPREGQQLLAAADALRDALATLVALVEIQHGPLDAPYSGPR
jgi:hypothetical protein